MDELDDVDVFTPDQYRELFGHEPEKLPFEDDMFGQNWTADHTIYQRCDKWALQDFIQASIRLE